MTCYFQIKRCLSRRWQAGVVSCILVGQSEIRFRLGINFNSEEIIWDCFWNNLGHFHIGNQFQFRFGALSEIIWDLFRLEINGWNYQNIIENLPVVTSNLYIKDCKILNLPWKWKGQKLDSYCFTFSIIASMPTARSCCYWGSGESEKLEERISKDPHFLLRSLVSALDP